MNRVKEIIELRFIVNGDFICLPCVSGRLKFDDSSFSIKCRLDGITVIEPNCVNSSKIIVKSSNNIFSFINLADIEVRHGSTAIYPDGSSNTEYLVHGKGIPK